jgi:hypothetical protein
MSLKPLIHRYLVEASRPKPKVRDLEGTKLDAGGRGKSFETKLLKAFDLTGLKYTRNRVTGSLWDIQPKGSGWERLVSHKNVNIKVAGARWMFGSAEFTKILPWDKIEDLEAFDKDKAAAKIKRILKKRGVHRALFLAPATKDIQARIIAAVDKEDVAALNDLLVKKNFKARKLSPGFSVRVSIKDNRIGSIAVDSEGKVFARSERPRNISGSKLVGFRAPRAALKRATATRVKTEARQKGKSLNQAGYESKYVIIYRAVPTTVTTFESMDYVTLSRKWATEHAEHVAAVEEEPAHVIRAMVQAAHVYEAYNPGEYFYDGPSVKGTVVYRT